MNRTGNIYLIWRKGQGSRRIPVGVLKKNATEGVRFNYLNKNLELANNEGFLPFTGFPETDKEYRINVLEILSQRLVKTERNDLSEYYEFWKIDKEKKHDSWYMLAQTQGLLPIDNFEFLADFHPIKGLNFISEIAGLTKSKIDSKELNVGDKLSYELETQNKFDKYAVKLLRNDLVLGYVKLIHSKIFYKSKHKIDIRVHHIESNGVLKRVFIDLKL
ncbi:hypothetical protein [uncultured Olleya sp.]|uniref:hypothetical protein n=1 Tax=uncultured Olleya sp. TaxID=757243 RepID=UPI002595EE1C|nr:hypothetical protein [uncultured Olleya sp.]